MLIWIHLSHCFQRLRDNIFFPLNWFFFSFAQSLIFFLVLSCSPASSLWLVLPGCAIENLWGLSLMPCSFSCNKKKREVDVFSMVLASSACLFLLCCGVSGEIGEDSLSGVMEAQLQRQVCNCSLGNWWAITRESWKRKARFHHLRPLPHWCYNKLKHILFKCPSPFNPVTDAR